jgi:pRiA4b ORF-3-like protein
VTEIEAAPWLHGHGLSPRPVACLGVIPADNHEGGEADAVAFLGAARSGLTPDGLRELLRRLAADGTPGQETRPSRRRPRRPDVMTYRIRADLTGTRPPLWRRLELASDLPLDRVHDVMQAAFGWTDSHLHRFASGPALYGPGTEYYLCPYDAGEGEDGVPEEKVRLDEVLSDTGDALFYEYDFGDGWEHKMRLEAVLPRGESAPPAVCTAGRRPGPPEDCGGVGGYELIVAATDPRHPDHAEALAEYREIYGDDTRLADFAVTPFDLDEINDALRLLGLGADRDHAEPPAHLPEPLENLLASTTTTAARRQLRQLIGDALAEPPVIDAETAARMVRPYAWLLDRVGPGGITLTAAGYLPPAHVAAAMTELNLGSEWIGGGNRESQTIPVLHLRESAVRMGLLRKHRGRLLITSRGRTAAADPLALWWQIAERMPLRSADACEAQAGLTYLVLVAAQAPGDPNATVARFLDDTGWITGDGMPLSPSMASHAAWDTVSVLRRLGAITDSPDRRQASQPTAAGAAFARAALRTWPAQPKHA